MNRFDFVIFTTGSNIHYGHLKANSGSEARQKLQEWAENNGYVIKRAEIKGMTSSEFELNTIPWYADN